MPSPRILKENEKQTHFLTLRVIDWINIFTEPIYFQIIINSLKYCRKEKGLLLHAYVIMTNHLHMIAISRLGNLSSLIRDFKRHTTKEIKEVLEEDNRTYILQLIKESFSKRKGQKFQVWHSENWPELVESEDFFQQKLDYIHENPVEKEYVERPEDWVYSSERNYYLNDNSVASVDKI